MPRDSQYWLPGYGLSRHVVLSHIHYFLGPDASARPYTYQVLNLTSAKESNQEERAVLTHEKGREGYLIKGMPLTREQIDDLALLSREYERQEAARMLHDAGLGPMMSPTWEPYINEPIPVPENKQRRRPRKPRPTSCYDSYDSYRRR